MFFTTALARTRLLMFAAMLLSQSAWAASPGSASKLGSAKDTDGPMQNSPRPIQPGAHTVPDAVFLRAVLWAFEPAPVEVRAQAIEDLGLLGDPRALNVLAQYAVDPNPMFARAALRAVSLIRHARAEDILCNLARHPTVPEPQKLAAIQALVLQNTPSAISFLRGIAASTELSSAIRGAARTALNDVPRERGGSL